MAKVSSAVRVLGAAVVVGASGGAALGQSFNIDFGAAAAGPADGYAGAGLAGRWNVVSSNEETHALLGLDGTPTGVTLSSATFLFSSFGHNPRPETSGTAESALLDDFLWLQGDVLSEFIFSGLEDGEYDLIVYGILVGSPEEPTSLTWISNDLNDFTDDVTGDGVYAGLEQGVTHARLRGRAENGSMMLLASGIFNFTTESFGNINGIQLVQVPAPGVAVGFGVLAGFAGVRRRR